MSPSASPSPAANLLSMSSQTREGPASEAGRAGVGGCLAGEDMMRIALRTSEFLELIQHDRHLLTNEVETAFGGSQFLLEQRK